MSYDPRKGTVSESFRRLNSHIFGVGGLDAGKSQPDQGAALVNDSQARHAGGAGVGGGCSARVTFCYHTHRLLDDDNYTGGMKPLRDAVARWLGIDDGDSRVTFKYHQIPTAGAQGVTVTIESQ